MIRLDVEKYCEQCLDFNPDITYPSRSGKDYGDLVLSDTIVRCENRKRCANIKRYLEQQYKRETTKEEENMGYISKHFATDNYDQLILEKDEWSDEVWKALTDIFGLKESERIVLSEYKLEAWGEE